MLSNPSARQPTQELRQHVYRGPTLNGYVLEFEDGLVVSSPEFCFLQMAAELPLVKLIELGFELCGTYSLPGVAEPEGRPSTPGKDFDSHPPLTSLKKLKAFAARMAGIRGHKRASRALRYIADNSASPMETILTMLLTLPYKLGGYGLPMPELNCRIVPVKAAKRSASKSFYSCDLFWSNIDLAVEYDSDLYHTGAERIASDSKRRNTLTSIGVLVITVTRKQIYSVVEFEKVARLIAGNMDRRLRFKNPKFADTHRELRKLLF
jgi:hypothetical protein